MWLERSNNFLVINRYLKFDAKKISKSLSCFVHQNWKTIDTKIFQNIEILTSRQSSIKYNIYIKINRDVIKIKAFLINCQLHFTRIEINK